MSRVENSYPKKIANQKHESEQDEIASGADENDGNRWNVHVN